MKYCLLLLIIVFTTLKVVAQTELRESITKSADQLLLNDEITSVSLAIVIGEEVFTLHNGKLDTGEAPNDSTLYEIASLTKTFTGTLLARAIVEEKVKIDDDIRNYLNKDFPNLQYNGQPITFRHLLTHTSGIPRMIPILDSLFENPDYDRLPFQLAEFEKDFSKFQFFEVLQEVSLDTIPGKLFNYSNAGANLVGFCLENILNKPYETLLQEYIFTPLKMVNSKITLAPQDTARLANGYNHNGIKMPFYPNKYMSAEGGIKSTVRDIIGYMKYHLDTDNPIVKVAHSELWNGQYGDHETGFFWQIFKDGTAPDKIYQNGGAFGTMCWMTLIPHKKIGVFIITNVSGPTIHEKLYNAINKIVEIIN